jgi:hypothetical protein
MVMATAAAIVVAEWPFVERAIALEDAPLAWLQSTLLAASAAICLCHAVLTGRAGWHVVAAALFALALDERFMGHERLKEWIWLELFDGDWNRAGRWPDVPILLEGVIGAGAIWWIVRGTGRGHPSRLLWSALAVGAVALIIDVASQSIAVQIWEELLELIAETLFLAALLASLNEASLRAGAGPGRRDEHFPRSIDVREDA